MKILYDYQMFSIQRFGGITRYFCEIMKHLPDEFEVNLALIFSDNHHLKENRRVFKKKHILPDRNFKGKYFIQKKLSQVNRYYSRRSIAGNKFDLFHPTFYDPYFLPLLRKPFVITVHDLILFKFDDPVYANHPRRAQMEEVIRKANRVIAISHNTKKDLTEVFGIAPEKIDVIHHGFPAHRTIKAAEGLGSYVLFVGQRSHHKNFSNFARGLSPLMKRETAIQLICVGKPFETDELSLLHELGIADRSVAMHVDDHRLNELYAGALTFVYPSYYEGFGMPILEAFANNCPVCVSDTSSMPEVAGAAGNYFDPRSPESIRTAIEKIVYDTTYRSELILAGKERLAEFSWQKAANETALTYLRTV